MRKISLTILIAFFTTISCSKDEVVIPMPSIPVNYAEENTYYSFLSKIIPNSSIDNVLPPDIYMELG